MIQLRCRRPPHPPGGGSADPPPPCPPDSCQKRPQAGSKSTPHPAKIDRMSYPNRRQNRTEISHFGDPGGKGSGKVRGRPGASREGPGAVLGGPSALPPPTGEAAGGGGPWRPVTVTSFFAHYRPAIQQKRKRVAQKYIFETCVFPVPRPLSPLINKD